MPIYEYQCGKCGHEFEREQRISDEPVKTCPECRSRKVKKLISQTSFVLKGGGWYSDLYSSAKDAKAADKGDAAGAGGDSGSEGDASSKSSDPASSDAKKDKKGGKKGGKKSAA